MQTVLITGGSRGIGAAMARLFSEKGWRVAFTYLNSEEKALDLSRETGALALRCDVKSEANTAAMAEQALKQFGHLDALICNAGAAWTGLTEEMPLAEYDRLAETNQRGAFLCIREALPHLRRTRGGILLISSMWGTVGASCETAYSGTKAALQCMARALAKEVGPSGVRVNCVAPGAVDTDMMAAYSQADKQALADETPLGRLCTPGDIAAAAEFLLGDGAAFITGQTLTVDGGFTL